MSQHMNMNALGGIGGPVGGQATMNTGTPGNAQTGNTIDGNRTKLHTYIYDYFLKNEMYDIARALQERVEIEPSTQQNKSPNRKEINGDSMDADSKEDTKPTDLPLPNVPNVGDSSFLYDWWCQFWDCFQAQRGRGAPGTKQYLNHVQQQARMQNERQRMMANTGNNMQLRNAMMQNGMGMQPDMKKAMQGGRGATPQQIQHQMQLQRMQQQQQQMMQQTAMQRDGSSMDINGQPRPQTPGSGENAPSPKRQRLEGNGFNGQMGPMGRGQPQGMQGQQVGPSDTAELVTKLVARGIDPKSLSESQFATLQMQTPNVQAKSMQVYAQSMRQQMQSALDSNGDKGMPNPNGLQQGSPAMDTNAEFFNAQQMRGLPNAGGPGGPNNGSNHALQDYQMQLMLLEQQNKKRLLMARQEQDSVANAPGGMQGPPGAFAPAMSPSGSRTGPSPNPDDQMKRGTPKMIPNGMPQPNPDGSMPQGRASPAPGFDPSQMNSGMAPNMYQMKQMGGMIGPNGQMMPATSHPAFNGQMNGQMNPQQLEFLRQNGNRPPNGQFMPGPPPGMMGGGPPQQQPNMTPRQLNAAMPPPPAPSADAAGRTQPSSPQQPAAPPTPSQTNKPNPKSKKDNKGNKKAPAKKAGANATATPAQEAEQPPTPTPAPPITPTAPNQPFNKTNAAAVQPTQPGQMQGGQPDMGLNGPFGNLATDDQFGMSLDFSNLDGPDVLDNFDFDSFLNNDAGDSSFAFDGSMGFGTDGGLEAGGDV